MRRVGFTLMEVLVSCLVMSILMFSVFGIVGVMTQKYDQLNAATEVSSSARAGLDIISMDLERMVTDKPICYSSGKTEQGYCFANAGYINWSAGYGTHIPSEAVGEFPSDRLGFFIRISEEEAEKYDGYALAHVLYFRAFSPISYPHSVAPMNPDVEQRAKPRLYRLYTPPDRVHERLKLLDPEAGKGDEALPRGPNYLTGGVIPDDHDWGLDANLATLSLVTSNVAQFTLELSETVERESSEMEVVTDIAQENFPARAESIHELLLKDNIDYPRIEVNGVTVRLKVCPTLWASRLKVMEWNRPADRVRGEWIEFTLNKKLD